jgi:hypothetical protein
MQVKSGQHDGDVDIELSIRDIFSIFLGREIVSRRRLGNWKRRSVTIETIKVRMSAQINDGLSREQD